MITKVKELFVKGYSDKQIANDLKLGINTVRYLRYKAKLLRRHRRTGIGEKIVELFNKGFSRIEIAKKLKVWPNYVSCVLVKKGIVKPRRQSEQLSKFIDLLIQGPKFDKELKKLGISSPRSCFKSCKLHGYQVCKYTLPGTSRSAKFKVYKTTIYYLKNDAIKAYKKLMEEIGPYNVGDVAKAMGIMRGFKYGKKM